MLAAEKLKPEVVDLGNGHSLQDGESGLKDRGPALLLQNSLIQGSLELWPHPKPQCKGTLMNSNCFSQECPSMKVNLGQVHFVC